MLAMTEERLLTTEEVANMLNLSEETVKRLLRQGKMPGYKISGSWRVDRAELREYLEAQRNTQIRKK